MSTFKNKDTNEDINPLLEISTIVISMAYVCSSIPAGRIHLN